MVSYQIQRTPESQQTLDGAPSAPKINISWYQRKFPLDIKTNCLECRTLSPVEFAPILLAGSQVKARSRELPRGPLDH